MNRLASALPLLALLSSAPLAAQAARDFQLPPAATPSPDTRVQGPVDTDAPVPVRPRAIETARPTPAPSPTATAAPAVVLPAPTPSRTAAQPRQATERPAAAVPRASAASAAVSSPQPTVAAPIDSAARLPLPSPTVAGAPAAPIATAQRPAEAPLPWVWIALGGLVLAVASAFLVRRRRKDTATPEIVVPFAPTASDPAEALAIAVEAVRMDRSVMNATVGYRVTIRNRTAQPLSGVTVEADLVSASGDRPAEQQLASTAHALTPRHAAERLAPGQSLRFEGQVRLPLSEASAIWQGRAALLVPLLRVRALASEALPVVTTLVIGSAEGSSARPQPFRLDEPPRSYAPLAQRVLDAVPARA